MIKQLKAYSLQLTVKRVIFCLNGLLSAVYCQLSTNFAGGGR